MNYNLEYNADKKELIVSFTYMRNIIIEEEMLQRRYHQERFQIKYGRQVSLDDIEVIPKAGDKTETNTTFMVKLGKPLHCGLKRISAESPESIRKLIESLREYNQNDNRVKSLTNYAAEELEGLLK